MNYDRIYQYRFKGVKRSKKLATWKIIADFIYKKCDAPSSVLDPAAGDCEFINAIPASERWAIDMSAHTMQHAKEGIKVIIGNNLSVDLPANYFEAIYISNFLEHLHSQEEVAFFLQRMYASLKPGGKICVMGPNFKYCYKEYFDFADHSVILSELGVAEHLYGAGFDTMKIYPKFLPLSFRSRIPTSDLLVKLYLLLPFTWNLIGKQFLIIARKSNDKTP